MPDPGVRSSLPEFANYKNDSLLTIAAEEALVKRKIEDSRGVVDRDGGLTFFYNGMGQLPPAIGNGDNWYPGTAAGGFVTRPLARGSNPMNRRVIPKNSTWHTDAGATESRCYLARVPQPYSPC